jgi:hypothetical protein
MAYAGQAAIAAGLLAAGQFLGVMLAMLLAVLVVTNEYAHQTATATFLTKPHRGAVIAAKFAQPPPSACCSGSRRPASISP